MMEQSFHALSIITLNFQILSGNYFGAPYIKREIIKSLEYKEPCPYKKFGSCGLFGAVGQLLSDIWCQLYVYFIA